MTLPGLLRFELRYQSRRVAFAFATLLPLLLALVLVQTGYGPDGVDVGSPYIVTQSLAFLSLPAVFSLTVFCAEAALRDAEHGMTELVYATPVGKAAWLCARFAGALLSGLAGLLAADVVLIVAPHFLEVAPDRQGPLHLGAHLWALAVIVLPNVLLMAAVLFATATLTRSTIATYVSAVAIYSLYWVAAFLVDSPLMASSTPPTREALARAAVLDPFGLSAFFEQTRYWTVAERDARPVTLAGRMLLNRALWLGVSGAVLAFAYTRFAFRVPVIADRNATDEMAGESSPDERLAPVRPEAGIAAAWATYASTLRIELRQLRRGWTLPAVALLWAFVGGMEASDQLGGEYGSRALATTSLLLDALLEPLLLLGTVAIAYYAAESAWRERAGGIDAITDATPASITAQLFAKLSALATLALALSLIAILVALGVQLATGMRRLEPGLWLSLPWFGAVPLVLFAAGALSLHAFSGNRWLGLLGSVLLGLMAFRGDLIGLEHPLLRFGATPQGRHSMMGGFGWLPRSYAAFVGCWSLAALLLMLLSSGVWPRGPLASLGERLRSLPHALGRRGLRLVAAAGLAFGLCAAALLHATTSAGRWQGSRSASAWQARYERTWRRLRGVPQPVIVGLRSTIRLEPEASRAAIAGTYELENRGRTRVDTVWLAVPREVSRATVRDAAGRLAPAREGMHVVALPEPLAPGARTRVRFELLLDRGGLRAAAPPQDVVANGSVIMLGSTYPSVGYRAGWEIDDPALRRKYGLTTEATTRTRLAAADSLRAAGGAPAWMTLETIIGTTPGQTALAPGVLIRQWDSAGRAWFKYVAEHPVQSALAITSARYEVARATTGGVSIEVWHHPGHDANVPRILEAASRTLDRLTAGLAPYPHRVLRIAEVPSWWRFGAYATPTLVLFPENRGFLAEAREQDVDLVSRRVAHEVAHQWWGHGLAPLDVAGSTLLVETLAKDAEARVIAAMHGVDAVPAMLAYDEDRYFAGRAADAAAEPPLLEVTDESYLYYGKGALAMHALRARLGDPAVDAALRALFAAHGGAGGSATSRDLQAALAATAQSALDSAAVEEWLAGRTLYELAVDSASAARTPDGWRIHAWLRAAKRTSDGVPGVDPAIDSVDVVLLDGPPGQGRVLVDRRVPLITRDLELPAPAAGQAWLQLDPRRLLPEADRSDDALRITPRRQE